MYSSLCLSWTASRCLATRIMIIVEWLDRWIVQNLYPSSPVCSGLIHHPGLLHDKPCRSHSLPCITCPLIPAHLSMSVCYCNHSDECCLHFTVTMVMNDVYISQRTRGDKVDVSVQTTMATDNTTMSLDIIQYGKCSAIWLAILIVGVVFTSGL